MPPQHPALEAIIMALRVELLLHRVADSETAVLFAEVTPHAGHLARALFGGGHPDRLRAAGGTAAEMVRQLAAMLPPAPASSTD